MADPTTSNRSLVRASKANVDVAPGEPDVRGWDVVLGNDETIGNVDDLIVDSAAGEVRYLDVDLDGEAVGLDRNRHVLIPISDVELDTKEKHVIRSGISRRAILKLPEYDAETYASSYDPTFR